MGAELGDGIANDRKQRGDVQVFIFFAKELGRIATELDEPGFIGLDDQLCASNGKFHLLDLDTPKFEVRMARDDNPLRRDSVLGAGI